MLRRIAWLVTAIKIRPTKMEIVARREPNMESLGIKRTKNATSIQSVSTKILERNALRKFRFKRIVKSNERGKWEKPKKA